MIVLANANRDAANLDLLLWGGVLAGVLLVGAAVVARLDRWRKSMLGSGPAAVDNLAAFRLSYERGELSEDEYRKIRARLTGGKPLPPPPPSNTP